MSEGRRLTVPLEPIAGVAAFREVSPSAIASRAAQYLGMSAYAVGGAELGLAVQDDADELLVPHVAAMTPDDERFFDPDVLDELTDLALRHHWGEGWNGSYSPTGAAALWEELSATHLPTTLLALLNYARRSDFELEAVAAAGSLAQITQGDVSGSIDILQRGLSSHDALIQGVAASLTGWAVPGDSTPVRQTLSSIAGPTSTTIHGTWGLVTNSGWHKPASPLHDHLKSSVSANLYADDTYFMWSGEYSDQGRSDGAHDLRVWGAIVSDAPWLDTVFAHSHGGNVALNALAAGQRIKMLVLLHTPAIHRSDEEWAIIRRNVGTVVAMRTRMDLVVLGDSLRHRENRMKFDPRHLPHFRVVGHPAQRDAWLSHSHFVTVDNWLDDSLADVVRTRYALIGRN